MTWQTSLRPWRHVLQRRERTRRLKKFSRRPELEVLEERRLLYSISVLGVPQWIEQGPGPIAGAGTTIPAEGGAPLDPAVGAVEKVVVGPTDPATNLATLYAATVNGGIWVTHDYSPQTNPLPSNWAPPTWEPLTDFLPSLSTRTLALDPTDPSGRTLYIGMGHVSHDCGVGGPAIGLFKTVDGGATWTPVGEFAGQEIVSIVPTSLLSPTGPVVLVGTDQGLYRSPDGGVHWTQLTLPTAAGGTVMAVNVTSVLADASDPQHQLYYAGVSKQGLYRSMNGGQTWLRFDGNFDTLVPGIVAGSGNVQVAVYSNPATLPSHVLYAVLTAPNLDIFWSQDEGNSWSLMDNLSPSKFSACAGPEYSLLADQTSPNVLFVTGYQSAVERGDRSLSQGPQWVGPVGSAANNTAPHNDGREMTFDSMGNLLQTDDGGIYRLINPDNDPGLPVRRWQSLNGNMGATEFYSVAYDNLNHAIFGGSQDNGDAEQPTPNSPNWTAIRGGDGAIVQVDDTSRPGQAIHYVSNPNLSGFTRHIVDHFDGFNIPVADETVGLNVADSNGNSAGTLFQVEANLFGGTSNSTQSLQPYVLDTVDPTRMLIGTKFLYESWNEGDTLTSLGGLGPGANGGLVPLNSFGQTTAMVYGGRLNGVNNADFALVGTDVSTPNGDVGFLFLRTAIAVPGNPSLADFSAVPVPPGTIPQKIVVDPDNWRTAYILANGGRIWKVTNLDSLFPTWTPLTGNLPNFTTDLRTIALVKTGSDQVLLAGGQGGVYRTINPDRNPLWNKFGSELPNAIAMDLHYYPPVVTQNGTAGDILLVGTLGRGAWTIANASASVAIPGSLQIDLGPGEEILLRRNTHLPRFLDVLANYNSTSPILSIDAAAFQQIIINATEANQIDLEDVPAGITVTANCGVGSDTVNISPSANSLDHIQGQVYVNQTNGGVITLNFDDQNGPSGATYHADGADSMGNSAIFRVNPDLSSTGIVSFANATAVNLFGSNSGSLFSGSDTYQVDGTDAVATTTLHTANGYDLVNVEATAGPLVVDLAAPGNPTVDVTPIAQNLFALRGTLSVNGAGFGTLRLNDQNDPPAGTNILGFRSYDVSNTRVLANFQILEIRTITATINYNRVAALTLNGGGGGHTYDIINTAARTTTTLNTASVGDIIDVAATTGPLIINLAAAGNPMVNFTPTAQNLDTIQGRTMVNGSGFGTVNLDDLSAPINEPYTLTASTFSRPGFGGLTYSGIASLSINAAPSDNSINPQVIYVLSTAAGVATTINAANGWHNIGVGLPNDNALGLPGSPLDAILGPVTVSGQAYQDNLTLFDSASTAQKTYTLNENNIGVTAASGTTLTPVSWQGLLSTVVLYGSSYVAANPSLTSDTYLLQSLASDLAALVVDGAWTTNTFQSLVPGSHRWLLYSNEAAQFDTGTPGHVVIFGEVWNVTGGPGGDDFQFSPNAAGTGGLNGVINGNSGTLDYSQDASPITVNLADHSATNLNGRAANGFSKIQSVIGNNSSTTLVGPDIVNYWNLTGTNLGNLAHAAGATGSFTFSKIPNLTGGASNNTFVFQPGGAVTGLVIGGSSTNRLDYSQFGSQVTVMLYDPASPTKQSATATGGIASIQDFVGSSATNNTLTGTNLDGTWQLNATGNSHVSYGSTVYHFQSFANLVGGSGVDAFRFGPGAGVGHIDGGGAPAGMGDWLDYSRYNAPIYVDLTKGYASGVTNGVINIQNVIGSNNGNTLIAAAQGSILVGGTNTLYGGAGRNLIISGAGQDTLVGGPADDILIGGTTSYDHNEAALMAILAEWQRTDPGEDYLTRIAHIRSGVGSMGAHLSASTVHFHPVADVLIGGAGMDWFWANLTLDTITNRKSGEVVN